MSLNPKQQLFVERYLVHLNASKAAEEAGYSKKTARSQGQRLLTNDDIQEEIMSGRKKMTQRNELDQDWVVKRLMKIGDSRMSKVAYETGGTLQLINDMEENQLDCIDTYSYSSSSNEHGNSESVRWKIKDPVKSLELLGRLIGMWNDKQADTGADKEASETIQGRLDSFLERFG